MSITQDQFDAAILEVTGGPNWDIVKEGLRAEIYQTQANVFTKNDWGEVQRSRGFAEGIAYCMNLRELTIQARAQSDADV